MNRRTLSIAIKLPVCLALGWYLNTAASVSFAKEPEKKTSLEEVLLPAIKQHQGDVAVAVKNLKTGESYAYKDDIAMPTASLIKFPVMIAAYEKIDSGKLNPKSPIEIRKRDLVQGSGLLTTHFSPGTRLSLRDAIRLMIAVSDNSATNLVINQVGIPEINSRMEALECNETRLNSLVFRRDTSVDRERSQKYGLGSTSARDMVKLAELLYNKKLVSEKASAQMLEHMFACEDKLKVPRNLPDGTKVAHKTGSVNLTRTDAGVMETPAGPIAFCILTNNNKDQSWGDKNEGDLLCSTIGKAAYDYFNKPDDKAAAPLARVLEIGAAGDLVVALQRTLNARIEPSPKIGADGDFGPETEETVKKFQKQAKLKPTGVVDAETWKALGPLVMEEEPAPEPAVANAEPAKKEPMDDLDGPPYVTAKAWAIIDAESGQLLAGGDEDAKREPASTTKIMTAYIVTSLAEKDPKVLDEIVTFSARADKTPGSTSDLKEGEKVPVGELLYGLMLPSGNDAACSLAEHFGSRFAEKKEGNGEASESYDSFIAEMNRRAAEIGMKSTHFENPHGLPNEKHVTTARDLALLGRLALKQPEFSKVVSTPQRGATVDSVSGYQRNVLWKNTNQLLRRQGYLGIKTGTTGAAGNCLVSCGERDGRKLIVVVLGATSTESRYADARNLYRYAWTQLLKSADATEATKQTSR